MNGRPRGGSHMDAQVHAECSSGRGANVPRPRPFIARRADADRADPQALSAAVGVFE